MLSATNDFRRAIATVTSRFFTWPTATMPRRIHGPFIGWKQEQGGRHLGGIKGRTRAASSFTKTSDFIKTAKWPPPLMGMNALRGARIELTKVWARLVGVVKSSAP